MPDTVLAMAAAGFCALLFLLAFTVQRAGQVYRAIVATIAVAVTLVTIVAFARLTEVRSAPLAVARADAARPSPVCTRQGFAPGCTCVVKR
jgi:hypothetical protein